LPPGLAHSALWRATDFICCYCPTEGRQCALLFQNYQLDEGNLLYRKPDSAIDSPRKVVTAEDVFNSIKKVDIELVHAGVNKTFHSINKHLHGVNKKGIEYAFRCAQIGHVLLWSQLSLNILLRRCRLIWSIYDTSQTDNINGFFTSKIILASISASIRSKANKQKR